MSSDELWTYAARVSARAHTHTHMHTCMYTYMHTHTHMHICTHAHMHTCTHTHMGSDECWKHGGYIPLADELIRQKFYLKKSQCLTYLSHTNSQ